MSGVIVRAELSELPMLGAHSNFDVFPTEEFPTLCLTDAHPIEPSWGMRIAKWCTANRILSQIGMGMFIDHMAKLIHFVICEVGTSVHALTAICAGHGCGCSGCLLSIHVPMT
jgi:hypothetical protein